MKLIIESHGDEEVTASFEGAPLDAVQSIAEVMLNNSDLCAIIKAAVQTVCHYEQDNED